MEASEMQRLLDSTPLHRALGLRVTSVGDDGVVLRAEAGPEHLVEDGGEYLHGGVVATVLDSAATFALIGVTGTDWSTVDLRVDYLRPTPAGALEIRGSAVQVGRRLGRARAELLADGTGAVLASATGTFVRAVQDGGATT
jgi:uncharacterized protein (TIGR00369 family)